MGYRNKTYVCFDADTDIHCYRLMEAWKENDHIAFDFHNAHEINDIRDGSSEETIKRRLRERLQNTKVLVILIGKNTKNLFKYVRWEIAYAIEHNIPIIAANLNGSRSKDSFCPPILENELAMFVSYGQKILDFALNHWPDQHYKERKNEKRGPFFYNDTIYANLYK